MASGVTIGMLKRLSQLLAGQDSNNVNISGGTLTGVDVTAKSLVVPTYTVAEAPDAVAGGVIYVSNGAGGDPILAFSDGTDWLRSDTGAAIAAA